jgi:hypothetical protein
MSFIHYTETPESREANEFLEDAIEQNDHALIRSLMTTKIDNRTLIPSVRCLSEAIFQKNERLINTLLSDPYNIVPNRNCLNYAADRYTPRLFVYLIEAYPELRDEVYWDPTPSIMSAIEKANVPLVRYLIENLNYPLSRDLFDYIVEERQADDPFDARVRTRRNLAIRRYLLRQISEHGVDDDSEDEADVEPRPSCVRRLF